MPNPNTLDIKRNVLVPSLTAEEITLTNNNKIQHTPPPHVTSLIVGDKITFEINNTWAGYVYEIQENTNLVTPNWTHLTTFVATSQITHATTPYSGASPVFHRIIQKTPYNALMYHNNNIIHLSGDVLVHDLSATNITATGTINTDTQYLFDGENALRLYKGTDTHYASVAVGQQAGEATTNTGAHHQTALGFSAGGQNSQYEQTAVGHAAGYQNSGRSQTAVGHYAGRENTKDFQTAIGHWAGYQNTGINQTAVGSEAGSQNSGGDTTVIGYQAGYQNSGWMTVAIGHWAGYQNTGSYQTVIGPGAGYQNSGYGQTAMGYTAGISNNGDYQTNIGYQAGRNVVNSIFSNTHSSNSVYLGANTLSLTYNDDNSIVIGANAIGKGTNTAVWGNSAIEEHYFSGNINTDSLSATNLSANKIYSSCGNSEEWCSAFNTLTSHALDARYVNLTGDTMSGALSTPSLSTDNLFVGNSSIHFFNGAEISSDQNQVVNISDGIKSTKGVFNDNLLTKADNGKMFLGRVPIKQNNMLLSGVGETWAHADAGNKRWYSIAMSSDGKYQSAVVNSTSTNNGIWYSTDYGVTWTQSDADNKDWRSIAMSSDGKYQSAGVYNTDANSGIWYSTDYGVTWTRSGADNKDWYSIAMSSDGQYQSAVVFASESAANNGIWYSSDYGVTWTRSDADNIFWSSIAMSSDGQYQSAVIYSPIGGRGIWRSTDYGVTWTRSDADNKDWGGIAMSSDGQYQSAVVNSTGGDNGIWYSTDYGVTWTRSDADNKYWHSIAMSSDAQYQSASRGNPAVVDNGIWYSSDYGVTWTQSDANNKFWGGIAMSSDGKYQSAVVNSTDAGVNGIWTSKADEVIDGNLEVTSLYTVDWHYFSTTWRQGVSGDDLLVQKYNGADWVTKGTFT